MPPKGAATAAYGDSLLPSKTQVLLQSQPMSQNVTACGLIAGQGGFQIFNQVVTRFESLRQAHKPVADSCASAIRRRHPGMRGGRGPGYQRLDATETWRIDRNRHAIDKASRRVETAFEFETQHAAEAVEKLAGAEMIRMALQARIVDVGYRSMLFHPSRNLERTFILMTDSHRERLHPAMEQKARVRIENPAEMVQGVGDPSGKPGASDHGARDDIGMSVEVLGPAMQRQVEADFCGAKINRTRESIVDDRNQAVLGGKVHRGLQVADLEQGIRDRLDVDRFGVRPNRLAPGCGLVAIDKIHRHPVARKFLDKEIVGAAVNAVLREQMPTAGEHREQRRRNRRHAA